MVAWKEQWGQTESPSVTLASEKGFSTASRNLKHHLVYEARKSLQSKPCCLSSQTQ